MNRRNVVKSLLVLPITGYLKPTAFAQLSQPASQPSSTFSLIFHGPFCFYRLPDGGFLAAVPEVKAHKFCYGPSATDREEPQDDQYVLAQTKYSTLQPLDESKLAVLHGKYVLDPGKIRCHIYLPAPLSIRGLELFKLESSAGARLKPFQGRMAGPLNQLTHLATATVFEFERKEGSVPYIRGLWEGNTGNKLHFFLLEREQDTSNPNETFQQMVQTVKDLDLHMTLGEPHKLKLDETAVLPRNIAPSDLLTGGKGGPMLNCLAPGLIIQE